MPKPAQPVSSCVPTVNAWPPCTCATVTTTAETAAMSSNAHLPWPAGPTTSAATPPSACRSCGAATETRTAPTVQTRGPSAVGATGSRTCLTAGQTALLGSSAVPMGSVCGSRGSVTEIQTARTSRMSLTAVSFSFCRLFFERPCLPLPVEHHYTLMCTRVSVGVFLSYKSLYILCCSKAISVFIFKKGCPLRLHWCRTMMFCLKGREWHKWSCGSLRDEAVVVSQFHLLSVLLMYDYCPTVHKENAGAANCVKQTRDHLSEIAQLLLDILIHLSSNLSLFCCQIHTCEISFKVFFVWRETSKWRISLPGTHYVDNKYLESWKSVHKTINRCLLDHILPRLHTNKGSW